MSFWTPLLRSFSKGPLSNPDKGYQIGATERLSTTSGTTVTDERALKIPTVWACVQLLANSESSLPLNVYEKTESGRKLLDRHPVHDLLNIKPNQYMKPRDFRQAMTVQMGLWSNAYAEIEWNGDRPVSIIPLKPGRMTPFIAEDGELTYHYATMKGVKVYAKKSILHLKGFGTDGVVGAERNNYARETYGLAVSAENYAATQFASGGRPGGVIECDKFLTPKQRQQVKDIYQNISKGSLSKNELWVLEGGFQYKSLDFSADQMQMLATRMHQVSEICRFFGVPEVMIGAGDKSSSWPASFEQQILSFLTFTLQGYIDEWECAVHDALVMPGEKRKILIDHDVSGFIKMDSVAKAQYLATLAQNGLATRNEARRVLNLPEVEGGDELTVQTNLSPLDKLPGATNVSQRQPTGPVQPEIRQ